MAKISRRKSFKASNSKTASRSSKCRLTTPPDRSRHPIARIALEGLDVAVLHRSARCDVMPIHTMILRPAQHRVRGELGAVVGNDHLRLAARADEHRQLACNPFARDRGVGDCRQTYARHIIDNVEDAEAPAPGRTGHERSRATSAR